MFKVMLARLRIGIILVTVGCAVAATATASVQARTVIRAHRQHRPHRPLVANILGGSTAVGTSLGMVARIVYTDGSDSFLCSGTVVAADVVLTAGHCAVDETTGAVNSPGGYQVLTGSQSLSGPGQYSEVTQVIPYPTFDPSTLQGDAALLVLATPTSASPVTLASDPTDQSLYDAGTATVITGWGIADSASDLPDTLQYGFSTVQSAGYCTTQTNGSNLSYDALGQLCALDTPNDADGTCNGDSGGPILATVGQTWVEIGLTSFGAANCSTAAPGYFTRTDTIDSWVQSEIQQNAPAAPTPSPPTTAPLPPASATPPTSPTPLEPESGMYHGRTTQHKPIRLEVSPSQTTIDEIRFGFDLRCTRHRVLNYTITPGLTWNLSSNSGTSFQARFHDSAGTQYRLAGTFSSSGTASGRLTVTWQSARYGRCTSGPVHWSAST